MLNAKKLTSRLLSYSAVTVVLCMQFTLVGCGKKGPLYIPEQRYPQKSQQQAPEKATQPTQKP